MRLDNQVIGRKCHGPWSNPRRPSASWTGRRVSGMSRGLAGDAHRGVFKRSGQRPPG
jgi:hypothetical protein